MGYLLPFTKWQSTLSDFSKVGQHLFSLKLCDFLVPLDAVSMGSNLGAPVWSWQHFLGPLSGNVFSDFASLTVSLNGP